MLRSSTLSVLLVLASAAARADPIVGPAIVIDGDIIEIGGERIRLLDIDAPELEQTCTYADGSAWPCGERAAFRLAGWIGGRKVICDTDRKDQLGRWLANCQAGGEDMAQWLASRGWAVPYRECICEAIRARADAAKAFQWGMWSGTFTMPWDWRAAN